MDKKIIYLAIILITLLLLVGCAKTTREIIKPTTSALIVGTAISPVAGAISGATSLILEKLDFSGDNEKPRVETKAQAVAEVADKTLLYLFLSFLCYGFIFKTTPYIAEKFTKKSED